MNLYAKYRYIFLFFQIVNNCFCQLINWCTETEPFRLKDTSCGSFDKICLSTDDQCTELRRACKHCPGNITVSMIENISRFLEEQTKRSKNTTDNTLIIGNTTISQIFNLLQAHPEKKEPGFSTYLSIVILHVVIWIFLLFEIRFKIITKLVQTCRKRKGKKEMQDAKLVQTSRKKEGYSRIFYSRKNEIQEVNYTKFEKKIENFEKLFSEIKEQLKGIEAHLPGSIQHMTVNFMIDNHGPIQLDVNENQNIIEIKRRICDKLPIAYAKDYKKMKFNYNRAELNDNNEYLMKCINPSNPNVNCYRDSTIKFEDYLILKLQSYLNLPSMLQIKKDETPQNVVKILENLAKQNNLVLFELQSETGGLIKVTKTSFADKDRLTVVHEKEEKFYIKYILSEKKNPDITTSSNTQKLSSLLPYLIDDFLLFRNKNALDLDKFIFEYQIDNISNLDCYAFTRFSGIKLEKCLETNQLFELWNAKDKNGKDILLKKYKFSKTEKLEENKSILNELKTFQITKENERFVQLLGTYLDDEYLYISMEFMSNGTLRKYLGENPDIKKIPLSRWLRQILTGLQFLHDNDAIQRDLNPSNIFLNEYLDLKLSNSNFAKFDYYFAPSSVMGNRSGAANNNNNVLKGSGAANNNVLDMAYLAPEISDGQTYGKECDIYSFGAVLSKILTGEEPFDSYNRSKIPIDYSDYATIIDSCMQHDPTKRETIQNLRLNPLIAI